MATVKKKGAPKKKATQTSAKKTSAKKTSAKQTSPKETPAKPPAAAKPRVFAMWFASVYPLYVQKAQRKGRTAAEVDEVIA